MGELKNPKLAIPVVLMAGIFWSFGPYVVRNIDQAHTVPWQYLFTRGLVIFILLNLYLYLEEGLSFISNYKKHKDYHILCLVHSFSSVLVSVLPCSKRIFSTYNRGVLVCC